MINSVHGTVTAQNDPREVPIAPFLALSSPELKYYGAEFPSEVNYILYAGGGGAHLREKPQREEE